MESILEISSLRAVQTQQTDASTLEKSLHKIEQAIVQKDWEPAYKELYSLFYNVKPTTSLEEMQRACLAWRQLMPFLDAKQMLALQERGFEEALVHFPHLTEEQLDLALEYARWHLDHDSHQLEGAFFNAMHYYAQALTIAERHHAPRKRDIHCLASRLLTELLQERLRLTLDFAYRNADHKGSEKVLNHLENLDCPRSEIAVLS